MNHSLQFDVSNHIAWITLNRPKQRNAFDDDMILGLEQTIHRVNADSDIKAMVITGAGKAFCAGGDVKQMASKEGMFAGDALNIRDNYRKGVQRIPRAMAALQVPAIAAVNGPAYGAGCDITTMCDIRIASEHAVFAESFITLGLVAGDGGAWFLPRAVGWSRAAEMTFTGEPVNAEQALEWGLVSRVVDHDSLMDTARDLAERIARHPGEALRANKQLLQLSRFGQLDTVLEQAASLQSMLHGSEAHTQAVEALLKKNKNR